MWNDTHTRIALDERRIYTTGFSGGARFAGMIAMNCAHCKIAGVIAHGAGYPNNRKPGAKDNLLYFLAAGDEDFNWAEVLNVRREREEAGEPYRVRGFSGPHQWAPSAVMEEAVEWMVLKATQASIQAPDGMLIDQIFQQVRGEAEAAEKRGDTIAQLGAYRMLVSDFSGLQDVSEYEKKLAALKKSPALKTALGKERDQIVEQERLQDEISPKLSAFAEGDQEDPVALAREIAQGLGRLRDQSLHARTEVNRHVAMRAFRGLWAQGIEAGQMAYELHHFDKAVDCFQLMSSVSDDAWPALLLAEAHAAQGGKKQAMKSLREAVKRGLKNIEVFEKDSRLDSLHADAEFQSLLAELKRRQN